MTKVADFFTSLGWSRDDAKWFWAQLLSGATLIVSGVLDVGMVADYVGVHISDVTVHRIVAFCIVVLWLAGKMQTSRLFGKGALPPKPSLS